MRKQFKKMREEAFATPERMRHMINPQLVFEVKLFTDKQKMVDYVNQLSGIENVEIYKIEDQLYKVLVSKRNYKTDHKEKE